MVSKSPVAQVVAQVAVPAKSTQQVVAQVAKVAVPAKSAQQVVAQVAVPAKSTQQVVNQQPAKLVRQVPVRQEIVRKYPVARQQTQYIEVPRKSVGLVRQSNQYVNPHAYYYNGVPSWRHHYYQLYPRPVRAPYHLRYATRWA